jgi:exosortase A
MPSTISALRQDSEVNVPDANSSSHVSTFDRRIAIVAIVSVVLAVAIFSDTAAGIVRKWWESGTFSHGFLIVPIAVYLIWTERDLFQKTDFHPSWWALVLLAVSGFVWMMGNLAAVSVVQQFALVAAVDSLLLLILGRVFARLFWFPLAYLFFVVPAGDSLIPVLQSITAAVAVWGVQLTGVPVLQQGLYIYMPSGTWEVAAACSGLRYLISSLAIGILFADITFRSRKRRLIFVAACVFVPILANGMRAFGILMLAHWSDRRLAVGVDHIIYGWIFFAFIMSLLFAVGYRYREPHLGSHSAPSEPATRQSRPLAPFVAASVLGIALLLGFSGWSRHIWRVNQVYAASPVPIISIESEWPETEARSDWSPHFRMADSSQTKTFRAKEGVVDLLVLYYRQTQQQSQVVAFDNEVVDNKLWVRFSESAHTVQVNGSPLKVREMVARGPSGNRTIWYWYSVSGRSTANRYAAKAFQSLARLADKNPGGYFVAISTDSDQGDPTGLLEQFLKNSRIGLETELTPR